MFHSFDNNHTKETSLFEYFFSSYAFVIEGHDKVKRNILFDFVEVYNQQRITFDGNINPIMVKKNGFNKLSKTKH